MKHLASLAVVLILALPCISQERVFRASSIDTEQNARLDLIEAKLASLQPSDSVPLKSSPIKPVASSKPYAVITIETLPGCAPCERWKAREARELRANGWTVIEAPLRSSRSAPYFRICIGDQCYSHSGFMSHGTLRSIIGSLSGGSVQPVIRAKQSSRSARYTTDELRAKIHAMRPGGWNGPVYADVSPRSAAKQHLVGPEHGFSWEQVNGLTQEEALILHDLAPRHGNKIFPSR